MTKVWDWIKKHWKWIVFPVGILVAVLGWFFWWRGRGKDDDKFSTPDDAADKAVDDVVKAQEVREAEIKKLEEQHADKLQAMSDEQKAVFKEIKTKTPAEVAEWIDKL